MYTYQQRLEYAKRLQRLQQAVVIKDNIHLTYKYKNRNKAYAHIDSVQDRINNAIIEEAVNGNAESIKNLGKQGQKLINDTLINERKRLHQDKNHKAINQATKSNSNYFSNIFNYRRKKIGESLEDKINKELKKKSVVDLSDKEQIQHLQSKFKGHGSQRLKNILTDAMHTNESNISFIKAVEDGFNYKVWKNGRVAKGRTRAWHKEKHIQAVPIDETFDIYGSYPAHMMYPGDLNGGAENVANCRCWLLYTNKIPSNLRKKTVFNVSPTFQQIWEKARKPASKLKTTIKKPMQKVVKRNFKKRNDSSKIINLKNESSKKYNLPTKNEIKDKLLSGLNELYKIDYPLKLIYERLNPNILQIGEYKQVNHKGITIMKIGNLNYLSFDIVKRKLNIMPKRLTENIHEIKLNWHVDPYGSDLACVYLNAKNVIEIYLGGKSSEYIDVIVHEATHILDHNYNGKLYGISNKNGEGCWEEAFIKDKEHMNKQGILIENDGFTSPYAKDNYNKSMDKSNKEKSFESRFAEDLADAVPLYLKNKSKFIEKYPNRAKILEEVLGV